MISEKLPTETRKQGKLSSKVKDPQKYADFRIFLEERTQTLKATAPNELGATKTQVTWNPRHLHTHMATSEQQCECCEEKHKIFKCGKFKKLSVRERAELIKVRKLCFHCLRPGHRSEDCDGSKCNVVESIILFFIVKTYTTETPVSKQLVEQPTLKQMTKRRTTLQLQQQLQNLRIETSSHEL